jgi:hypothetical protein
MAPAEWDTETWQGLNFAISEPHLLQYEFLSEGRTFTIRAHGDPGCTGRTIRFERSGRLNERGAVEGPRDIAVVVEGSGPELDELAAELLEDRARRLCSASYAVPEDEGDRSGVGLEARFIRDLVAGPYRELLMGTRAPEGAVQERIVAAYEQASLCWSHRAVVAALR